VGRFADAYPRAVDDVLRYITPAGLDLLARHNPGWQSGSFDVAGYLRASETRYLAALDVYSRCGGRLGESVPVLDVGGFLGAFPLAMARAGSAVTISERYDYYYGAFDELRAMLEAEGVAVWDADLTQEGMETDDRFELVANMAMLEHLANSPRPLMANMRRCLSEDGRLVVEVPNIAYWPNRMAALRGRSLHPPLQHVFDAADPYTGHHREYTAGELRDLLDWTGYRLLELTTVAYTPPRGDGLGARLLDWPRFRLASARELLLACAERDDATGPHSVRLPRENVYGHVKRLHWIRDRLLSSERAVEFGCGSGAMLTLPLRVWGYEVDGVDLDVPSIEYGRGILAQAGVDPGALTAVDLRELPGRVDAIIASEVLEHLNDAQLEETLALFHERLEDGGKLLVTVPNGWGWFEGEAFLWHRTGFHRVAERGLAKRLIAHYRNLVAGDYVDSPYQSTLADSPHRQRFSLRSIRKRLKRAGFEVEDVTGSVLACGPFSHTLLTGVRPFMELNGRLGDRVPALAAGFYVAARKR
jgi:2-polyprenyl-3-methyl-5-hydroxy-6-metoxy-1,4-benzoquinol methylase